MMNNPIAKRGSKHLTKNRVPDDKTHTSSDTITTRYDILIQPHQIIGKISFKTNLRRCVTFILASAIICSEKVRQQIRIFYLPRLMLGNNGPIDRSRDCCCSTD